VLLRGTAIVSALTLISRILGFVRDLLVARLLGTSIFADAFFVAFRIPNLLRSFVAEGALTSAFTPVFASSLSQGKESARLAMRRTIAFLLTLTGSLTAVLVIAAPDVVRLLAPGFEQNTAQFSLCVELTRIMAPYILCVSLVAMLNAALNALNIFGTSAWAQIWMNVVLIIGATIAIPFDSPTATRLLAISALLGGVVQIIAQVPTAMRSGLSLIPSFQLFSREVREVVGLMIPATLGASVYQVTIFIATILASLLPTGSVSWLFYADRVAQFPIGIFSIALASVLLPALSNASAKADTDGFRRNISNSLRFTSFCVIPMAAGIWGLALPITQLLFERGAFSSESSVQTARALQALCFGLWASSCHSMIVRAFIARRDTLTPTMIGLVSLCITIGVSLVLMGPIATSQQSPRIVVGLASLQASLLTTSSLGSSLGHVGLALASSTSAAASLLLIITIFHLKIGAFPWREFAASTLKSTAAAGSMIAALVMCRFISSSPAVLCACGAFIGLISYCGVAWLLRSREMLETLHVVKVKWRSRYR
jgi:putative peptidoglycan lipid II flippase